MVGGQLVEELIIGATDGTLSASSLATLRTHMLSCPTCPTISREHERLAQRLATPIEDLAAQRESLERVRHSALAKTRPSWSHPGSAIALFAGASLVVGLIILGSFAIGEAAARLQIPERELVSESTERLGEDRLVLRVEEGRFAASVGQTSGVMVSAELLLTVPRTGTAELRFAPRGEPYGVLAAVPDLSGATRLRIENRLPQMDAAMVIDVWLHLEGPQTLDSSRLTVQVEPRHGGLRARPLLRR